MATTTTAPRPDRTYPIVKGIAYGAFITGLALSVIHTYDWFHSDMGATVVTAAFVPLFVDGFQVVGRLIRGPQFAASTRRVGWILQAVGAALALTANILAGHSLGDKLGGAIFVLGYIAFDVIAHVIRPATEDTAAQHAAAEAARSAAASDRARRSAATRAKNKADAEAAAKATQRAARSAARKARMDEIAAAAPVSPAPVDYDTAAYI